MKPSTVPGLFYLISTAPKKFKKVKVPSLVASSYSSSRDTDENEDLDDTAAGPTPTNDPNNADAPSSP